MATEVFNLTGAVQRWRVPTGVKIIDVVIEGASSSTRGGGRVAGRMRVKPGEQLFIVVGEKGNAPSGKTGGPIAYGGGGAGGQGTGPTRTGGWSGGGGSWIRYGSATGPIRGAAGGAGGTSGDGGLGGRGGQIATDVQAGEQGALSGMTEDSDYGLATGGTLNQGGRGGTTSQGSGFRGEDGGQVRVGRGGRGGQFTSRTNIYGGGGGGGGYFPGGGGQAGIHNLSNGGGGAGGSNFVGGLFNATLSRGGAGIGNGKVTITWDPAGGDTDPVAANEIKINGIDIADEITTRSMGSVTISGMPNDPDQKEKVRLYVRYSKHKNFADASAVTGTYDDQDERDKVILRGLDTNTLYYLRIHTQEQKPKKVSVNYTGGSFWTNRSPNAPDLLLPLENAQFSDLVNVTFTWNHTDPDGGPDNTQAGYDFWYRRAAQPGQAAGDWYKVAQNTNQETRTFPAGTFKANASYEWMVRTKDQQGMFGKFAEPYSFKVTGTTQSPVPTKPVKNVAVRLNADVDFTWLNRKASPSAQQTSADIRTRVIGAADWIVHTEVSSTATASGSLTSDQFAVGFHYEWQVRVHSVSGISDWSDSAQFWTVQEPGRLTIAEPIDSGRSASGLGEGNNRVFIYDRGGMRVRGEIKNCNLIRWNRIRDDISGCTVRIDEFDEDTRTLLRHVHAWRHEIVVFREDSDGKVERVWEGPVTRKGTSRSSVEVEAKDPMAYVYRRIMRQGYTDAYQIINGTQAGQKTVVERTLQILLNALVYDDPNIIDYLTPLPNAGDARTSRIRPDYSRMAWEEIDDLAAVAGLDYTTVGRRIIFNDTHRPVGRLPEMTDKDFSEPPVISEYGMSAAYYFAVTNGGGIWGDALPKGNPPVGPEGWIEQLASAYGEDTSAKTPLDTAGSVTSKALQRLRKNYSDQAALNLSGRWPVPVLVRVPDNSRLSPTLGIGINALVPGVWIPLRADNGFDSISQWQKLDLVTVEQDKSGEKVTATMSPAPNGGADPDRDAAAEEA